MLRLIHHQDDDDVDDDEVSESKWLSEFGVDFKRRFVNLLGFDFRKFSPGQFSVVLVLNKIWAWSELLLILGERHSLLHPVGKKLKGSKQASKGVAMGIFRPKRA